jgi:hypothetical protein
MAKTNDTASEDVVNTTRNAYSSTTAVDTREILADQPTRWVTLQAKYGQQLQPHYVGVNGYGYYIPFETRVEVPESVYFILVESRLVVPEHGDEHRVTKVDAPPATPPLV